MSIKIPVDFNFREIWLDPLELIVRDNLKVDIENWAKFRHTINLAVNSDSLKSNFPISPEVKSTYLELGKSHYEVITMLGATKISLITLDDSFGKNPLIFKKSFKEFYMHAGSVLDNLARLIYIVNILDSVSEPGRYGLKRHEIGYGSLEKIFKKHPTELNDYSYLINNKKMNEIKTIRNNLTHSWPPAIFIEQKTGEYFLPIAMRKREQYYLWPHDPDEKKKTEIEFNEIVPLIEMLNDDWENLEQFQNEVFINLTRDIIKFEKNHDLKIV